MLSALDLQFAERGWEPLKKSYVGTVMATMNQADHWLLDAAYRGYIPAGTGDQIGIFIAVTIDFEPAETWNEPVCLVTAARFIAPKTRHQRRIQWSKEDAHQVAKSAGAANITPVRISDLKDTFLEDARACAAGAIPLCELRSVESLAERVVTPVLTSLPS